MRESEKSCDNCAHSYIERENFKLRQKCRSSEYTSTAYTHEMLMEDRVQGYCRYWTPEIRDR